MPFLRPTLTELRRQAINDLMTAPGGDGAGVLRFAVSQPLSWAIANVANGHYGHLDWIARESVPFTATGEYLEAWGSLVGISRKPAVAYAGTGQWSGTPGTLLPSGTPVVSAAGMAYATTADATVDGGGIVIAPIAAVLTGSAGSLNIGDLLYLTSGIAGIDGAGQVASTTQPGVDVELDDPFRTRILQRWANPPQGGSAEDYLQWALAVPGVTRAWVNPLGGGPGTVSVYTMWDDAEAAHGGFPQGTNGVATAETRDIDATGDQLVVADAIYPLRPVTALVYSLAPIAYPVAFTIHPKVAVPSTVQTAVLAAIDDVFVLLASPLADILQTSPFEAAIAAVPGMPSFTLLAPAAPISTALGYLPVRGAVTYA